MLNEHVTVAGKRWTVVAYDDVTCPHNPRLTLKRGRRTLLAFRSEVTL